MGRYFPRQEEDTEENLVNLTPLIDVVFIVLISFILIAPMLEIDSVELASAGNSERQDLRKNPFTITVKKDNTIWINKEEVSPAKLSSTLREMKKLHEKEIPQLFHDKGAFFGTYQMVKNALEEVGFTQMDLVVKPE